MSTIYPMVDFLKWNEMAWVQANCERIKAFLNMWVHYFSGRLLFPELLRLWFFLSHAEPDSKHLPASGKSLLASDSQDMLKERALLFKKIAVFWDLVHAFALDRRYLCLTKISLKALKSNPSSSCLQTVPLLGMVDQEMPWVVLSTWCWPDDVPVSLLVGPYLALHFT